MYIVQFELCLTRPSNTQFNHNIRTLYMYISICLSICVMQLVQGVRKCSNMKVPYLGDPLLQPVRSYENTWLVRCLYSWSLYLNDRVSPTVYVYTVILTIASVCSGILCILENACVRDGCVVQNVIITLNVMVRCICVWHCRHKLSKKNSLLLWSMLTRNNTVGLLDWIVRMCAKILYTYTNLNLPLEALV